MLWKRILALLASLAFATCGRYGYEPPATDACVGPACANAGECGNARLQSELGEECDDGNRASGDGCSATCASEWSAELRLGANLLATDASINAPTSIALDGAGNLYLGESFGYRLRRLDAQSGIITTVAGNGVPGSSGDGGPATAAHIRGRRWRGAGRPRKHLFQRVRRPPRAPS